MAELDITTTIIIRDDAEFVEEGVSDGGGRVMALRSGDPLSYYCRLLDIAMSWGLYIYRYAGKKGFMVAYHARLWAIAPPSSNTPSSPIPLLPSFPPYPNPINQPPLLSRRNPNHKQPSSLNVLDCTPSQLAQQLFTRSDDVRSGDPERFVCLEAVDGDVEQDEFGEGIHCACGLVRLSFAVSGRSVASGMEYD